MENNHVPEVRPVSVPPFVLKALAARKGEYSELKSVFHCVWLGGSSTDPENFHCVGVAGDGDNACYEIFKWRHGKLECTDEAYGGTATALLRGLTSEASV